MEYIGSLWDAHPFSLMRHEESGTKIIYHVSVFLSLLSVRRYERRSIKAKIARYLIAVAYPLTITCRSIVWHVKRCCKSLGTKDRTAIYADMKRYFACDDSARYVEGGPQLFFLYENWHL